MADARDPGCDDMIGMPYCSVVAAVGDVGDFATIRVADGFYTGDVVSSLGSVVAIIGEGSPVVSTATGSPSIRVNLMGIGYLDGLVVRNGQSIPAVTAGGDIWLDESVLEDASIGLVSTDGRVHLERTLIRNNSDEGVLLSGGEPVTLRSVIIGLNGGLDSQPRGLVSSGTPFTIMYSTIAANAGTTNGAISAPTGTGEVFDSILISEDLNESVDCPGCTIENSVVGDGDFVGVGNNVGIGNISELNFNAGFEISLPTIADSVAEWNEGDPLTDINGAMRPGVEGMPDFAGAKLP